uniref:SexP n=1 Tax=Syzygites megalocarpus TaxID=101119 RepID=G8G8S0_9FUNG|nr:SexP [Syzygites megalocarpus]AET35405.1 SexP [Syzygites megalocarpus]AET35406.1 SexP [Syzygites megalocarpus]AET35407.1 SexP [Syzygites megalocarpus]
MKELNQRTNLLPGRKLKPRPLNTPTKALNVESLVLSHNQEHTEIIVYPSQVHIKAKQLLDMIDNKTESIKLENTEFYLKKDDIFSALQFYVTESIKFCDNDTIPITIDLGFSPPKRPTNAFILYRSTWGKVVRLMFHEFNNSQISKLLGAMWKWSSTKSKQKYIQQAEECRKIYKEKFPNHVYNPRKRNESKKSSVDSYMSFEYNCQSSDILYHSNDRIFDNFQSNNFCLNSHQVYNNPIISDISNNEWEKVCNIISEILPNSTVDDDQLWASFQSSDFSKNLT